MMHSFKSEVEADNKLSKNNDNELNVSISISRTTTNISENQANDNKKIRTKCFFFRAHSQNRLRFDLFIMFLATFNCFQVPYNMAFSDVEDENIYYDILNGFIDAFFIADIFVNFRTSIVDDITGDETLNTGKIAWQYIKSRFWIDLLASIPVDIFGFFLLSNGGSGTSLRLFGLLKLVRVLRLSRLITYLNIQDDLKMSLKLIKLVFFLILFIH
jgi:hypothetical protein